MDFLIFMYVIHNCFICAAPQISLCRSMLGSNPGLLRLWHWQPCRRANHSARSHPKQKKQNVLQTLGLILIEKAWFSVESCVRTDVLYVLRIYAGRVIQLYEACEKSGIRALRARTLCAWLCVHPPRFLLAQLNTLSTRLLDTNVWRLKRS